MSTSVTTANGMVVVTQIYPQGTENTAPAPAADQRCHVVPSSALCQLSEKLKRFLKGEPRPLGTVQILIGVISIVFGVVLAMTPFSISAATAAPYWTGVLIKAALGMNVVSSVAAGIAICFYCVDLPYYYGTSVCSYPSYQNRGYYGYQCENIVLAAQRTTTGMKSVLLIFSLLQFCVSVSMAAFACKAACHKTYTPVIVVHNSFRAAEVVGQDCESEDAKCEPPPYTV
ncbi:Membrane-spanning 4-domains subfamily A member 4A [Acipenser ruthenus]|uniref:Membrane-spanning 4-domains subfamily A member 4A n=1 Tax=Acipenser ruthenus TaxID=7906 RepID=A0A444UX45_ACIRT|nr:Membrane-spanning 4-domains subfamily A member 4A [Acipenser ruthenus]